MRGREKGWLCVCLFVGAEGGRKEGWKEGGRDFCVFLVVLWKEGGKEG